MDTETPQTVAKKLNSYMQFCKDNRAAVKGLPVGQQGKRLGELYRTSKAEKKS